MKVLIPLTVTEAMLTSCSVPEPSASETAWVSAGTYVLGDRRIRSTTHRVYECIQASTGRTALPEDDVLYWTDVNPTEKWAAFDTYTSTATSADTSLSYTLAPGFFQTLALYGLAGSSLDIVVKDAPGGTITDTRTISLYAPAIGLYEYLFEDAQPVDKVLADGFPLSPTAEVTLTLTGSTVSVGMLNLGRLRDLVSDWGGTEYGASAEPVTLSRIKTDEFGTTTIKRGNAATGMRASVVLPKESANLALRTVQQVLDVPVSWIATDVAGYEGLNVFGLGSTSLSYEGPTHVSLNLTVKGMI